MGFPRGMRRDRVALERRRLQAARLLEQGWTEAEVARRAGVHRQSVNRWAKALKAEGRSGLRRAPRAGRPPKLNQAEVAQLEDCLKQGPEQFGYLSGLLTLARVAKLIEQQHGVRYDASQVWRILRKLNWSCQRPAGGVEPLSQAVLGRIRRGESPCHKPIRHTRRSTGGGSWS